MQTPQGESELGDAMYFKDNCGAVAVQEVRVERVSGEG